MEQREKEASVPCTPTCPHATPGTPRAAGTHANSPSRQQARRSYQRATNSSNSNTGMGLQHLEGACSLVQAYPQHPAAGFAPGCASGCPGSSATGCTPPASLLSPALRLSSLLPALPPPAPGRVSLVMSSTFSHSLLSRGAKLPHAKAKHSRTTPLQLLKHLHYRQKLLRALLGSPRRADNFPGAHSPEQQPSFPPPGEPPRSSPTLGRPTADSPPPARSPHTPAHAAALPVPAGDKAQHASPKRWPCRIRHGCCSATAEPSPSFRRSVDGRPSQHPRLRAGSAAGRALTSPRRSSASALYRVVFTAHGQLAWDYAWGQPQNICSEQRRNLEHKV